jgi:phage shock protein A
MTNSKKLKNILLKKFMPLLESKINDMFKMVEKENMISLADREELEELQKIHAECIEILIEIESGEMGEDEAKELLEELESIAPDFVN